nr:MAG TPA: hypothetical protein [Caudoviricetes sp.]
MFVICLFPLSAGAGSRPGVMLYYFSFFCCSSLYFSSMIRSSKLDNTDVSCARSVMWRKD